MSQSNLNKSKIESEQEKKIEYLQTEPNKTRSVKSQPISNNIPINNVENKTENEKNNNNNNNNEQNQNNLTKSKSNIEPNNNIEQEQQNQTQNNNLNLNAEVKIKTPRYQKSAVCWNCYSNLLLKNDCDVVECPECHKLNRIPQDNFSNDQKVNNISQNNNQEQKFNAPYVFGIAICPYCHIENRFQRGADTVICYQCQNTFDLDEGIVENYNENYYNNYSNFNRYDFRNQRYKNNRYSDIDNIDNNYYINQVPNIMQMSNPNPAFCGWGFIPFYQECNCCSNDNLLLKILKAISDQKPRNNFIPYPMFPFPYEEREPTRIEYIPIKTEEKKPKDEGYKITIRKRPRGLSENNRVSKSSTIEKIFFTK